VRAGGGLGWLARCPGFGDDLADAWGLTFFFSEFRGL
jgi:hypothetical protein